MRFEMDLTPEEMDLTPDEKKAISALHRLAKRWPSTLTLLSMGGNLYIVPTEDDEITIFDEIIGIPNGVGR